MNQDQNRRSRRLAFVDLDDTLLGPDKVISPENLQALDRLRSAQVEVVIASGRHHQNITGLEQLGRPGWVLSSHGGVVRHEQTGEVLAAVYMESTLVLELCERARSLDLGAIVYHRDGAYQERTTEWTDLYAREAGWDPVRTRFANLHPEGFQKVIWAGHAEQIRLIAPVLTAELGVQASVLITNPELLEFFPRTVNKAAGAELLARKLGIATSETFAFGDGNNDVELLRWAGVSVAMNHGRETARRAARFVTPPGPPETAFSRAVDLALSSPSIRSEQ